MRGRVFNKVWSGVGRASCMHSTPDSCSKLKRVPKWLLLNACTTSNSNPSTQSTQRPNTKHQHSPRPNPYRLLVLGPGALHQRDGPAQGQALPRFHPSHEVCDLCAVIQCLQPAGGRLCRRGGTRKTKVSWRNDRIHQRIGNIRNKNKRSALTCIQQKVCKPRGRPVVDKNTRKDIPNLSHHWLTSRAMSPADAGAQRLQRTPNLHVYASIGDSTSDLIG